VQVAFRIAQNRPVLISAISSGCGLVDEDNSHHAVAYGSDFVNLQA